MSENNDKIDIRLIKTEKACDIAMHSLLEKRNFQKITVSDICAKAMVSRASFYTHYDDKYDFLKGWLTRTIPQNLTFREPYEYIENAVNKYVLENKQIIRNIVTNSDKETMDILFNMILRFLNYIARTDEKRLDPKYAVKQNIYAGGITHYISLLVENNFKGEVLPMNVHLYEIISKWHEL